MNKLLASLPRERARELRALCRRVIVGAPASSRVVADVGMPPAELLSSFEESFTGSVGMSFDYRDREQRVSRRRFEPHGLLVQSPVWYVLARDTERGAPRMFRMDRIVRPRLQQALPFRPDEAVIWALLPEEFDRRPLL